MESIIATSHGADLQLRKIIALENFAHSDLETSTHLVGYLKKRDPNILLSACLALASSERHSWKRRLELDAYEGFGKVYSINN